MGGGAEESLHISYRLSLILKEALKIFWPHLVTRSFFCFSLLASVAILKCYSTIMGLAGWINIDKSFFTTGGGADELGSGYLVLWKLCVVGGGDRSKWRETRCHPFLSFLSFQPIEFCPTHDPLTKRFEHAGPVDPGTTMHNFAKYFSTASPR